MKDIIETFYDRIRTGFSFCQFTGSFSLLHLGLNIDVTVFHLK